MSVYYYCPYCGTTQLKSNTLCIHCKNITPMVSSQLDSEYYRIKSMQKYGDYSHWRDILLAEARESPLFDETKYNSVSSSPKQSPVNQPKCPTCQSTNITKISDLRKGTHAVLFGLFSQTARSQFECKNCGYKW